MKKNFKYALLSAIALVGAVSFSACSSSDEIVDNPDYNPADNTVKAQFTIAFPGNVAKTRQSATTVQKDQTITSFRGMDNIILYPFATTGAENTDPIASTSTKLGDAIPLTSIIKPDKLSVTNSIPAGKLTNASNSVLYNDVSIPVGTGSFLFYGKAIDNVTDNFVNGALTMTQGDPVQPANITFNPVQIYPSSTTASTVGAALATYLTNIARATNWAECADENNKNETWYNKSLGDLYTNFISMHAGSSRTVQAAIQDLYATVKNNTDAVSANIRTAITNSTYASVDGTTGLLVFTEAIGNSDATYYPGDVNLPDGAAMLEYAASTKTFTQKIDGNGNTGDLHAKFADYMYPASLYYYCNSGIKTSNSSQQTEYDGLQDWTTITGKYTNGSSVGTATRSVAILDPIQYGVGRLDATVKADAIVQGDDNILYDKNGEAYTLPEEGFTVTGILIGGQKQVKFDFTTNTEATSTYTIFDDITKSQSGTTLKATTTASDPNYTLALETAADEAIYVAVELVNNGAYFQGADGVVPTGCKFYLVAQLTPSNGTGYNATTLNQIFKQDYNTIVTFTIKAGKPKTDGEFPLGGNTEGLGKAYNTIPDLRTPKMELGLSVNLEWKSGLAFDVNL